MADAMDGPWEMLRNFGDETTYHTQPSFVLKRSEQEYLYFADRWNAADYFQSSYVTLPIEFEGDKPVLNNYSALTLEREANAITFEK